MSAPDDPDDPQAPDDPQDRKDPEASPHSIEPRVSHLSSRTVSPTAIGPRGSAKSSRTVSSSAIEPRRSDKSLPPAGIEPDITGPTSEAGGSRELESSASDVPPRQHPAEFPALRAASEPSVVVTPASSISSSTDDDAILPPAYSEHALRDAAGVKPRTIGKPRAPTVETEDRFDDDEPPAHKRSRKTIVVAAISIVAGLSIAGLVFLGRANAQRYLLVCGSDHVSAEQGRSFPPWGSHPLSTPEYKPIALPPNAECKPNETEDPARLEQWYLDILVDRASTALTAHNMLDSIPTKAADPAATNSIDLAAAELDQALLLTRAPERRKQRTDIERLLGDVDYWRAALKLRAASAAMLDAAKQFEAAAARPPRHASDAAAWGSFLHRLVDELHAGPSGVTTPQPSQAADTRPIAPPGVALPVEPPVIPEAVTQPSPDAGVPTGGVLL